MAVAGEVGEARYRELVPQQRLGRHQDQRLAEIAPHLAAKDVEIIGRVVQLATCILSSAQSCR